MNREKAIKGAEGYATDGKYDKAIKEYQKILSDTPTDLRIKLRVADLLSIKREMTKAVEIYREVGEAYLKDRFFLKAIAVFKAVLKLNPTLVDVNEKLGTAYQRVGLKDEAVNQFLIVAGSYDNRGMRKDALMIRKKIVDLDPGNTGSRIRLAELYQSDGKTEESISQYERTAEIFKEKGDKEGLIEVYEKMLFFNPNNTKLLEDLSKIYFDRKDYAKVLQRIESSPPATKNSLNILAFWADALFLTNKIDAARKKYKEYFTACVKAGDSKRAAKVYQRIATEFSDDDEYIAEVADIGKGLVEGTDPDIVAKKRGLEETQIDLEKTTQVDTNKLK